MTDYETVQLRKVLKVIENNKSRVGRKVWNNILFFKSRTFQEIFFKSRQLEIYTSTSNLENFLNQEKQRKGEMTEICIASTKYAFEKCFQ